MEHHPQENKSLSLILLVAGIIVLALTAFALLSNFSSTITRNSVDQEAKAEYRQQAMNKLLAPVGSVASVDKSLAPVKRTGEEVYNSVCAACHSGGLLGAPKFADNATWAPRAAVGLDALVASAIAGKGAMPARGGNPSTTDEEIRNAILHMTKDTGLDLENATGEASDTMTEATVETTSETIATPVVLSREMNGIQVYAQNCFICHDTGVEGSPKIADKAAWSARLEKGVDALYTSAIEGLANKPARGGNPSLSDEAIKAAVDYMASVAK